MGDQNYEALYKAYSESYNEGSVLSKHHIDSFNYFVMHEMQDIVRSKNPITMETTKDGQVLKVVINFLDVYALPPRCLGKENQIVPIYPNAARINDKTYNMDVFAHYTMQFSVTGEREQPKLKYDVNSRNTSPLLLGSIPTMVRSKFCSLAGYSSTGLALVGEDPNELGGYFIAKGKDYCIIMQENKTENFVYKNTSTKSDKIEHKVWIQSKVPERYEYPYYTTVRMTKSQIMGDKTTKKKANKIRDELIYIQVSISKSYGTPIPLSVFMRALGVVTDREIYELICYDDDPLIAGKLRPSLEMKEDVYTENDALLYIAEKFKKYNRYAGTLQDKELSSEIAIKYIVSELLDKQLFPHIGKITQKREKIFFLGYMVRKTINLSLGIETELDRDNYGNKRILTSGKSYGQLFMHHFDITMKNFYKKIDIELANYNSEKDYSLLVPDCYERNHLEKIVDNINSGKWPAGSSSGFNTKEGVSQLLERKGTMDTVSYINRINTPVVDNGAKNINIHQLHLTHWGCVDPYDTPDGSKVGVIKHKTYFSEFTQYVNPKAIIDNLRKHADVVETKRVPLRNLKIMTKIIINGSWLFCIPIGEKSRDLAAEIREWRRMGINRYMTVVMDYETNELRIYTDSDRIVEPYFIIDAGKPRINDAIYAKLWTREYKWNDLLIGVKESNNKPIIEYLHSHEIQENCLLLRPGNITTKIDPRITHADLDSTSIMSMNLLLIPFANYNQGPRLSFQAGMQKQAVGIPNKNYRNRFDKSSMILLNSQKPLVTTIGWKYSGMNDTPAGVNCTVALMTWTGYNQEDAIIVNRNSLDNGLFNVYTFKMYSTVLKNGNEKLAKPDPNKTRGYKVQSSYAAIDIDGMPIEGKVINPGDVIIGKVKDLSQKEREKHEYKYSSEDKSETYKETKSGIIEKCARILNEKGWEVIKVRVRILRKVINGDKLACYTGDHDVLTARGWIPISAVTSDDKLASLTGHDGEFGYFSVKKVMQYRVTDERICEVENDKLSLRVTGNHRMYIRQTKSDNYEVVEARNMAMVNCNFLKNANYTGTYDNVHLLEQLKTKIRGGCEDLPEWVWSLTPAGAKVVLEAFVGHSLYHISGRHDDIYMKAYRPAQYHTNRADVCDNLQRLALHAGFSADVRKIDEYCYRVSVNQHILENEPDNSFTKFTTDYSGFVYCCEVESPSGIIYVRRNGKPVWCGNSRSAQKGTCALIMDKEDMPFTEDGIVPDLIFNPHGIIKRMTMAHLIEPVAAQIAARKAAFLDATAFHAPSVDEILKEFRALGFKDNGDRVMYNGITGKKIQVKIYTGPIYYQRLKHMVDDKIFARATGPLVQKTRQPIHGRKEGGGLRLGYMEKDSLLAHGASHYLKESFFDKSDKFEVKVSEKSGMICPGNDREKSYPDPVESTAISTVQMPWMGVFVNDLLMTVGIAPRMILEEDEI